MECLYYYLMGLNILIIQMQKKFSISQIDIRKIFNIKKSDYIGLKIFYKYGDTFCTGAKIKKEVSKIC